MRRLALLLALSGASPARAEAQTPAPCERFDALQGDARSGAAGMARAALAIAREPALAVCARRHQPSAWANPPDPLAWAITGAIAGAGAENAGVAEAALPSMEDPDPLVRATAAILCSCAVSSPPRCLLELRRLGLGPEPRGASSSGLAPSRAMAERVRAAVLALRSDDDGLDATLLARAQEMLSPPDAAGLMATGSWSLALDAMSLLPPPDVDAVVGLLGASPPSKGAEQAMAAWLRDHAASDVLVDALGHGARSDGVIAGALRYQPGRVNALARAAARAPAQQATAALGLLKGAPDEELAKVVTVLLATARRPGLATSAAAPLARALVAAGSPLDAVARAPDGAARSEVLRLLGREETITAGAVRAGLRSADRDVRRAALEAARNVAAEDAAALLPELLAFVRVPRTAAEVWDWREAPGTAEDLRPPDPCPPEAQRLEALALDALTHQERHLTAAINAALDHGAPHERAAAAWVVREVHVELTPALTAALVRNARHRDVGVRVAALAALEDAPNDAGDAWTAVAEAMIDRSSLVRLVAEGVGVPDGAAIALDAGSIAALVGALDGGAEVDPSHGLADRARTAGKVPALDPGMGTGIESALMASRASAVPALVAALDASPDPLTPAGILVRMGSGWGTPLVPEAQAAVRDVLMSGTIAARRAVATAAAHVPAFRDLIAASRDDADPELRAAAIIADPPRSTQAALDLAARLAQDDAALRREAMELLRSVSSHALSSAQLDAACGVTLALLPDDDEDLRYDALWAVSRFECAWSPDDAASIARHLARMPDDALIAYQLPPPVVSAAVGLARSEPDTWPLVAFIADHHAEARVAILDALRSEGPERAAALHALSRAVAVAPVRDESLFRACESIAWSDDAPRDERARAIDVLLASRSAPRLERLATSGPPRLRHRAALALMDADWQRGAKVLLARAMQGTARDRAQARARLRYIASRDDLRAALSPTPQEDAILDDARRCD